MGATVQENVSINSLHCDEQKYDSLVEHPHNVLGRVLVATALKGDPS